MTNKPLNTLVKVYLYGLKLIPKTYGEYFFNNSKTPLGLKLRFLFHTNPGVRGAEHSLATGPALVRLILCHMPMLPS